MAGIAAHPRDGMHSAQISARFLFFTLILLASLCVAPLFFWEYGGDIMFQYVNMDCFGSQFWSGDLYPRWCYEANAGLGAPLFLYYFPLAFYISTLFYPLTWLGLPIPYLYLFCLWLACIVSGYTAWRWFRDMAPPRLALLFAAFYLLLPYRLEVMTFRAAYGELWALAFAPLVFMYTRRLAYGQHRAVIGLSASMGLCLLSNMPAAVITALASGAYMLAMALRNPASLLRYGAAMGFSALLALFYLAPAMLYKSFITTEGVIDGKRTWSNDYLTMANIIERGQVHVVLAIAVMIVSSLAVVGYALFIRRRITELPLRREIAIWSALVVASIFLLFPVSAPVWDHLGFIGMVAYPWRVQQVTMVGAIWLALVIVVRSKSGLRAGDRNVAFVMLALLGISIISARIPDFVTYGDKIQAAHFVTQREYRTIWTDKPYIDMKYILKRHDDRGKKSPVQLRRGDADITRQQWKRGDYRLSVNARTPVLLHMGLQYFPTWQVLPALPEGAKLLPEKATGQMLLSLPAGQYELTFTNNLFILSPGLIRAFYGISLAAWLLWGYALIRQRRLPSHH